VWNGKLIWGRLTHSRVLGMLANPSYAGAYVFGRFQSRKQVSRIASPEMLPGADPLPHLICSPRVFSRGSIYEACQHGHA